eukprot:gene6049-7527_t
MKKILGLRTCIYRVADISKAKAWYAEAFGFEIAGYELGLQPEETAGPKGESVFTYWGVEDVDGEYQRLLQLGATAHEEPTEVGGGIKVAAVKDPWENVLGIIYN